MGDWVVGETGESILKFQIILDKTGQFESLKECEPISYVDKIISFNPDSMKCLGFKQGYFMILNINENC